MPTVSPGGSQVSSDAYARIVLNNWVIPLPLDSVSAINTATITANGGAKTKGRRLAFPEGSYRPYFYCG